MKEIKIKAPAKINLTLEVLNRRSDGYHNIQSIMQAVSLYDYLTLKTEDCAGIEINLSGNSNEIPYNEKNLVYKAAVLFFEKTGIKNCRLSCHIEKNIPVSAGLAGGSTDAAGAVYALNKLFNEPLNNNEINALCAKLGSDLNFCLNGGCGSCTSRGEITAPLPVYIQKVSIIKPKNISISAKEAYTKFAALENKQIPDNTSKLKKLLRQGKFDKTLLYNSLENAVLPYYPELQEIKQDVKNSLMSGSGSAFFVLDRKITAEFDKNKYDIFENLETIKHGAAEIY